uniref:ATP synthase F0 subunit 8 n=1 Tax=Marphysa tamurai TaxID=2094016 RepID=A0A343UQY4_9ANNE|nr:ATP synthase F0 subunit 8 [Marphysa tamurai]AVG72586.1 ATP synthase F0 subunit 8 [Marphysa tamurai]
MPHLSPLKWKAMILILLTTIAILSSASWWNQLPKFPTHSSSMKAYKFPQWPWF